mmetsp:Transcript_35476/g.57113  ORF Transcript_35476/g.57113 Transcript_35476/m.57113 type:complete len:203 (+) Transcript_35476:1469-2077(+)
MQARDVARSKHPTVAVRIHREEVADQRWVPVRPVASSCIVPEDALRWDLARLTCVGHNEESRSSDEDQDLVVHEGRDHLELMEPFSSLPEPKHLLDELEGGSARVVAVMPERLPPVVHLQGVRVVEPTPGILLRAIEQRGQPFHSHHAKKRIVIERHHGGLWNLTSFADSVQKPRQVIVVQEVEQQSALGFGCRCRHPFPQC